MQFEPRWSCLSVEILNEKAFIKIYTLKTVIPLFLSHTQVDRNGATCSIFSECKWWENGTFTAVKESYLSVIFDTAIRHHIRTVSFDLGRSFDVIELLNNTLTEIIIPCDVIALPCNWITAYCLFIIFTLRFVKSRSVSFVEKNLLSNLSHLQQIFVIMVLLQNKNKTIYIYIYLLLMYHYSMLIIYLLIYLL